MNKTTTTSKTRHGNTLVKVTVEATDAEIAFADILESVRVVPDDDADAPWDNCDGFEHRVVDDATDGEAHGSFWADRRHRERIVLVHPESWGNYRYWRERGASKQVAFELERAEWR